MRWLLLLTLAVLCGCGSQTQQTPASTTFPPVAATGEPSAASSLPAFNHIFLIVFENKDYADVIGSAEAPYLNSLAAKYSLATDYYAVAHPSLPNYLALVGGSTFGVESDCTACLQHAPNLADLLEAQGRDWKAYMEDLPRPCFLGASAGQYALKHDPWLYFDDIRNSAARCTRVVPLTQLSSDLADGALPDLVWITPNLCHDMHDCSVKDGDTWLASFLPSLLAAPAWQQGGLLLIVWDEGNSDAGCCGDAQGGHVPLLVIAPNARPGYRATTPLDHYSILRTIADAWSLGLLGGAATAPALPAAFFSGSASP